MPATAPRARSSAWHSRQPASASGGTEAARLLELADPSAVPPLALAGWRECHALLRARGADFEPWARAVLVAFDRFRVLAAVREGPWGVAGLNAAIAQALERAGALPERVSGDGFGEGRPLMVTRNQPALGVFNGDIGLQLTAPDGSRRLWLADGDGLRSVAIGRLDRVEPAFALTVHKSQGSEFGQVALVLPPEDSPLLTRELIYTGLTRAREGFVLVAKHPALLAGAVARRTRRISGLAGWLD
jgi:exodeoxyribonuclease V alpha subunit